jgi:ABC-type multidrug transport system permease subunit
MRTRKFFLVSLLLVFCGIFAHLKAFGYASEAVEQMRIVMGNSANADSARAKAAVLHRQSDIAVYIGLACAILSAFHAFVSYRKEESAPQMVVVVFLLFYAVLHLGVV